MTVCELSQLCPCNFAKNIQTFLYHLASKDGFKWEMDEEITKGSLIVHQGQAVHPSVKVAVNY
jgi:NAD(P) transhydrogenase subunit alpha